MSSRRPRERRPPVGEPHDARQIRHLAAKPRRAARDGFVKGDELGDHLGFERLIFFSDAVFAIAITLLVIDIRLPANAGADLQGALRHLAPNFFGFVVSFFVIAAFWTAHHRTFRSIRRYDRRLIWINILILMSIAFLPFSTSLLSSYGGQPTAVVFYALNLLATSVLFLMMWLYAVASGRLVNVQPSRQESFRTGLRLVVPSLVILASIGIAQRSTNAAEYSWLTIPFIQSLAARTFERFSPVDQASAGQATR